MSPWHKVHSLAERYDLALHYMHKGDLPPEAPSPSPTCRWPKENIELLERYLDWLLGGGVSEGVTNTYHLMMAGHVFGLTLKPHAELDLDRDLECALAYVESKKLSASWNRNCKNSLVKFRRFLRQERGLGEETKAKPFDSANAASDLPLWLVNELNRYQHVLQRNWRDARIERNIHRYWCVYLKLWRFFNVQNLAELKRQRILDYVDHRLGSGHSASGINADLHYLHTFLLFLQDEGYSVPQSLLRIPSLQKPDSLPRYLTDEQVKKLRDEIERNMSEAKLLSHRRLALLDRAVFHLLWQGGMRLGEVEELRLEDLDFGQKRLSVRDGKGRKDRTIYLTETTVLALVAYLAVRGKSSADHVFLFRNAPLSKDLIRSRLKTIGERIGLKVYPHRLRHTCATQLLNAGCRITSIQRFLGHKDLSSTLVYARAHDQAVADDYFAAMQRVEQNLELGPRLKEQRNEFVNLQQRTKLLEFADQLAQPELCWGERLAIGAQLLMLFGVLTEHPPG